MLPPVRAAMRESIRPFARKALESLGVTGDPVSIPYVRLLCEILEQMERGDCLRQIINLPPRHLKTLLCSVVFIAWLLGRNPAVQIILLSCSEALAREIASGVRRCLDEPWYRELFPETQIAKGRGEVMDFATTAQGTMLAASVASSITGRGADFIIIDDPVDLTRSDDVDRMLTVNEYFDMAISSRLNNPSTGRVLVIGQRVHAEDLSGHLIRQGGYRRLSLPFIATETTIYPIGEMIWTREAGTLLRPDAFLPADIQRLQRSPKFNTAYQQMPDDETTFAITADQFRDFDLSFCRHAGVVLSVDPASSSRGLSSGVVQAWCNIGDNYYLVDQYRGQVPPSELENQLVRMRTRYQAHWVLIENTGIGPALIDKGRRRNWNVVPITPIESKAVRLNRHKDLFQTGRIHLPIGASFGNEFVQEFTHFPSWDTNDQVDAATQFFDFMARVPRPNIPGRLAGNVVATSTSRGGGPGPVSSGTAYGPGGRPRPTG